VVSRPQQFAPHADATLFAAAPVAALQVNLVPTALSPSEPGGPRREMHKSSTHLLFYA
jgi:hypothetical protein